MFWTFFFTYLLVFLAGYVTGKFVAMMNRAD